MRLIKLLASQATCFVFLTGLVTLATGNPPAHYYKKIEAYVIHKAIEYQVKKELSLDREIEEELAGLDSEDTPAEDKTISRAIEKDESFWKDLL